MSRLSHRKVREAKAFCRKRDGDKCQLSKRLGDRGCGGLTEGEYRKHNRRGFILHHIDNNPSHNPQDGSNWELGCASCNHVANPRGRSIVLKPLRRKKESDLMRDNQKERLNERAKETRSKDSNESTYTIKNPIARLHRIYRKKRKKFNEWLFDKISAHGSWDLEDVINAGSEIVDADQQTVSRWLDRGLSSAGIYDTDTVDNVVCVVFKARQAAGRPANNSAGPSGPN